MLFTSPHPYIPLSVMPGALSDAAAEALARDLIDRRWAHLSSDEGDPLGMLFSKQKWVAGWLDTHLIVLVREQDEAERFTWHLYQNGQCIYTEKEGGLSRRMGRFRQLLASERLPTQSRSEFVAPLCDALRPPLARKQAVRHLLAALMSRPDMLHPVRDGLFDGLEAGLGQRLSHEHPPTPSAIADSMRLQRLAALQDAALALCDLVRNGLMREAVDLQRLDKALRQLEAGFRKLAANTLLRLLCEDAMARINREAVWRQRFRFRLADSSA